MNKRQETAPINSVMGFYLNPLHYRVGQNGCALMIPDNVKDCAFSQQMKKSKGQELYGWLYVARESAWEDPARFRVACSKSSCEECELFKDYSQRLKPIEMSPVSENGRTIYRTQDKS